MRLCLSLAMSVCLAACAEPEDEREQYQATIRWTTHGIPHVVAQDVPSAAYGQGWAFAKLDGCILADQIVKVRGERARWLGPGEADANIDSDFVHRFLDFRNKGIAAWEAQSEEIRALVQGYVAGYNAYITERGDSLPCRGQPWLQPITAEDLMAHYIEIATLASSRQLAGFIAAAQPPGSGLQRDTGYRLADLVTAKPGSNGWGIGRDVSSTGGGMVFANPHFPWEGELKLYESQLTVEGELDVYGVSLMGVVGVLIGFNEAVGWTHTVSAGHRFTFYVLELDPANPTAYIYDGQSKPMEGINLTVEVLEADGSIGSRNRTMWRTPDHGPVVAIPDLGGWSTTLAVAFRDANELNDNLIAQFHGMNTARSLEEFQAAHAEHQGIPWVNTMSASAEGDAWYIDSTPSPNLSPDTIAQWEASEDFVVNAIKAVGAVALPGNTSSAQWVVEDGARDPGLVPYARMPQLLRSDFISNANDSHWLTNPLQPLTGYSPMHGAEGTPRTPRTRMNATMLLEVTNAAAVQPTMTNPEPKLSVEELASIVLGNRGMVAELLRDEVVARCRTAESFEVEGRAVALAPACDALAAWDLRLDLDSAGALMWREFVGDFDAAALEDGLTVWATPFDPADPVGTPNGLSEAPEDPADDRILEALANAILRLEQVGYTPITTLREAQFTKKGAEIIPIHGGSGLEGTTNIITYSVLKTTAAPSMSRGELVNPSTDLTTEGYVVNYGTSFIMAMQFTPDGPEARAFLTYSQSDDPSSPYYADQTRLFSNKQWRRILYREDDILADPGIELEQVSGTD
jgi:acyl-homoserine-lactone acylase